MDLFTNDMILYDTLTLNMTYTVIKDMINYRCIGFTPYTKVLEYDKLTLHRFNIVYKSLGI